MILGPEETEAAKGRRLNPTRRSSGDFHQRREVKKEGEVERRETERPFVRRREAKREEDGKKRRGRV